MEPDSYHNLQKMVRDGERNLEVEKNDAKYKEAEKSIKPAVTVDLIDNNAKKFNLSTW